MIMKKFTYELHVFDLLYRLYVLIHVEKEDHRKYFAHIKHIDVWWAVVAQWIRPQTLNCEVPSLNMLATAVVPLGKTLYPHCLVSWKGLKAVGPLVACL